MSDIIWTPEQSKVLNSNGNTIVSAAAGAGKTAVMTEKIVRAIIDGRCEKITDMLVMTFNRGAAGEMKRRIEARLTEYAENEEDLKRKRFLYRQAQDVIRASISTIHSFCSSLLRRYFYLTDIAPDFRIAEDVTERALLRTEVIDLSLEEFFGKYPQSKLLQLYRNEDRIIESLDSLITFSANHPDGDEIIKKAADMYMMSADELKKSEVADVFADKARWLVKIAIDYLSCAADGLIDLTSNPKFDEKLSDINNIILILAKAMNDYDALTEALNVKLPVISANLKHTADEEETFLKVKFYVSRAKELISSAKKIMPDINDETIAENMTLYPAIKELLELKEIYERINYELKQERSIVEFSDLERIAYELLGKKEVQREVQKRYKLVFVDECQDINPMQDGILSRLAGNGNMFYVGDVKQSIYRFRSADPTLFLQRMSEYEDDSSSECLTLNGNFRSCDAVLNFTNDVFNVIMTKRTGSVDYKKDAQLVCMRGGEKGKVKLDILYKSEWAEWNAEDDNDSEIDVETIKFDVAEARCAIKEVKKLLGEKFYDAKKKESRFFKYSDIAIIVRNRDAYEVFVQEFSAAGIPIVAGELYNLYNALEIQIIVNLLKLISNRHDDIAMMSVMRSAFGGFTVEELAIIKCNTTGKDMYSRVCRMSAQDDDLGRKCKKIIDLIENLHREASVRPIGDLINHICYETDCDGISYYTFISAWASGGKRAKNIEEFCMTAKRFGELKGGNLNKFLRYIDCANEQQSMSESNRITSGDAVTMITMHKSKGLEYNAVIIPKLEKEIISRHASLRTVGISQRCGIGLAKYTLGGYSDNKNIFMRAFEVCETDALIADEMRLLYVALTRAKERLILISKEVKSQPVHLLLPSDDEWISNKSGRFMMWILDALSITGKPASAEYTVTKQIDIDDFAYEITPKLAADFNTRLQEVADKNSDEQLKVEYNHDSVVELNAKATATGKAERHRTIMVPMPTPDKKERTELTATEKGNAAHKVLEKIAIKHHTESSARAEIDRIKSEGYLSEEEAESVNVDGIVGFFDSEPGRMLINSPEVRRECEFAQLVDAGKFYGVDGENEQVLVQGVIDCCFMDNGEWVVIDYKTDSVSDMEKFELEAHAKKYLPQIMTYAEALKVITGTGVKAAYVYFLESGFVKVI